MTVTIYPLLAEFHLELAHLVDDSVRVNDSDNQHLQYLFPVGNRCGIDMHLILRPIFGYVLKPWVVMTCENGKDKLTVYDQCIV